MSLTLLAGAGGARPLRRGAGRRRPRRRRTQPGGPARDELLAHHPDSPLLPEDRPGFTGLRVAPYDPAYRFEVEVDPDVEPHRLEVPTATDGVVPFERIGVLHLPDVGDLDVWWLDSYGGGIFVPVKDALAGTADLRRRPLPAGHGEGRRPRRRRRPGHRARHAGRRPQLRLQPVLRLRPGLGLPAGPARQHRRRCRCGCGELYPVREPAGD